MKPIIFGIIITAILWSISPWLALGNIALSIGYALAYTEIERHRLISLAKQMQQHRQ